jgi:hypothetical protein
MEDEKKRGRGQKKIVHECGYSPNQQRGATSKQDWRGIELTYTICLIAYSGLRLIFASEGQKRVYVNSGGLQVRRSSDDNLYSL